LSYEVFGNSSIRVVVQENGLVNLSSPQDWNGQETVYFRASSGSRSNRTNDVTLTVNSLADCGDSICESGLGESCSSCSTDCGACQSSGGGGGGGGGSAPETEWVCGEWSECVNGRQTQECTSEDNSSRKTNSKTCTVQAANSTPSTNSDSNTSTTQTGTSTTPEVQVPGTVSNGKSSGNNKANEKSATKNISKKESVSDGEILLSGSSTPDFEEPSSLAAEYGKSDEKIGMKTIMITGIIVMIIFGVFIYLDSKRS
jgi:hypothetical protein